MKINYKPTLNSTILFGKYFLYSAAEMILPQKKSEIIFDKLIFNHLLNSEETINNNLSDKISMQMVYSAFGTIKKYNIAETFYTIKEKKRATNLITADLLKNTSAPKDIKIILKENELCPDKIIGDYILAEFRGDTDQELLFYQPYFETTNDVYRMINIISHEMMHVEQHNTQSLIITAPSKIHQLLMKKYKNIGIAGKEIMQELAENEAYKTGWKCETYGQTIITPERLRKKKITFQYIQSEYEKLLKSLNKNITKFNFLMNFVPFLHKPLLRKLVFNCINNKFEQDYDFINQTAEKMSDCIINSEKNISFEDCQTPFARQALTYITTKALLNHMIPNENVQVLISNRNSDANAAASYTENLITFYPRLFSDYGYLHIINTISHEVVHAMQHSETPTGIPKKIINLLVQTDEVYQKHTPYLKRIYEAEAIEVADTTAQKYMMKKYQVQVEFKTAYHETRQPR